MVSEGKQSKDTPQKEKTRVRSELLQADASDHDWFEERGPRCHLHLFIDDATSKLEGGHFELEETTVGFIEGIAKTVLNIPRILVERQVLSIL